MGLLNTATSANMIVDEDLVISYSRNVVYGRWHWWNLLNVEGYVNKAYEYHRYAKKTYRYVGMDYDSACSTASALVDNYTRAYFYYDFLLSNDVLDFYRLGAGLKCQTQIAVLKQDGHMYLVIVNVNEDDIAYKISADNSISSIFDIENKRTYEY